jgi:hypothetical protein
MIVVRRRDPSFSGYSDVRVMVNEKEVTKLSYNGEQQFQLPPGIHSIYFKRSLAGKSNSLTLDVKSEHDVFIVECSFNKMASAISASIISVQREEEMSVQSSLASADEIMKFKELLDGGIISQDEFDVAKKRLLDAGMTSENRVQTNFIVESKPQTQKSKTGGCLTTVAIIIGLLLLFWAIGNIGGSGPSQCRQLATANATARANADDRIFVDNLWRGFWATHNQCPTCRRNGDVPAAYR